MLFSQLSKKHFVFCHDDRETKNSSVKFVTTSPLYDPTAVEFVFGPTQKTLPAYDFSEQIDLALIDGPHAFPFAELDTITSTHGSSPVHY